MNKIEKYAESVRKRPYFWPSTVNYLILIGFVSCNFYVLFNRDSPAIYLRVYHAAVAVLMLVTVAVMTHFVYEAWNKPKLPHPHSIPRPTLVAAVILTIGVTLGYSYFLVFNWAYNDCDYLVDWAEEDKHQQWLDAATSAIMILFSCISLFYVLQRTYYGKIDTKWDSFSRHWINVVLMIVWVKIVIYKGYLSQKQLCQRKELDGYWCPVGPTNYTCHPSEHFKGMQQTWYYLHKGLLNSSIISCASELFPVMLVAHWLACGGAETTAENLEERNARRKSVRKTLHSLIAELTHVYGEKRPSLTRLPPLRVKRSLAFWLNAFSFVAVVLLLVRWFTNFYYTIKIDDLYNKWMPNEVAHVTTSVVRLMLFATVYYWACRIEKRRTDVHHKAEARGDIVLIFGSIMLITIRFLLQMTELIFQRAEGLVSADVCYMRIAALALSNCSRWLQFLALRRIVALSDSDLSSVRSFLPSVAGAGFVLNWIAFGLTFLETSSLKYQLGKGDKFKFATGALICNIFTQVVYPA
ncbi:Protein F55G1.15 [Aphelenchoides avenae]|nr:Protein F55G1.15 [Aphelenchus avenae]